MRSPCLFRVWLVLVASGCCLAAAAVAQEKSDFKTHPFFKHFIGEWTTTGELKGTDGNALKITEEWKAEALAENTLSIEGKREINGNSTNYKWTITRNPDSQLYEAIHQGDTNNADTQRFEVQMADGSDKVEFTGLLGDGDTKLVIVDTFTNAERDSFESKVTLTDGSGAVTLSGTLVSKKGRKG